MHMPAENTVEGHERARKARHAAIGRHDELIRVLKTAQESPDFVHHTQRKEVSAILSELNPRLLDLLERSKSAHFAGAAFHARQAEILSKQKK